MKKAVFERRLGFPIFVKLAPLDVKVTDAAGFEANAFFLRRLSTMDTYYIPRDGGLNTYKEYISMLPNVDNPEAFGQHPNADIASQITEARTLFETLLSLQPKIATQTGVSQEEKVKMSSLQRVSSDEFCDM